MKLAIYHKTMRHKKKLLLFIILVISFLLLLISYKFFALKKVVNYVEDNLGFEMEEYKYKFILSPLIEIDNLFLENPKQKSKIYFDNISIDSSLFSNEYKISVNGNIKVNLQNQEVIIKPNTESIIIANISDNNNYSFNITSPNIEIFDVSGPVFSMKKVDFSYDTHEVEDDIIVNASLSSDNYSQLLSKESKEFEVNFKYRNFYKKTEYQKKSELPYRIDIDKIELVAPGFSILTNGQYEEKDYDFKIIILNKENILDSIIDSVESNSSDIFAESQIMLPAEFKSEEDFIKYINRYTTKINSFLNDIAKNNQSTSRGRDVFHIKSDIQGSFAINDIESYKVYKMFNDIFAQ